MLLYRGGALQRLTGPDSANMWWNRATPCGPSDGPGRFREAEGLNMVHNNVKGPPEIAFFILKRIFQENVCHRFSILDSYLRKKHQKTTQEETSDMCSMWICLATFLLLSAELKLLDFAAFGGSSPGRKNSMATNPTLPLLVYRERSNVWQLRKILADQTDVEVILECLNVLGKDPTVKLDAVAYTIGISACGRALEVQKSCQLLESMLASKVRADVPSFNAAISSCQKTGRWWQAFGLRLCREKALIQNLDWNTSTLQAISVHISLYMILGNLRPLLLVSWVCEGHQKICVYPLYEYTYTAYNNTHTHAYIYIYIIDILYNIQTYACTPKPCLTTRVFLPPSKSSQHQWCLWKTRAWHFMLGQSAQVPKNAQCQTGS